MKFFVRLRTLILALALLSIPISRARAYGPDGHHIVGAIADERLANTPAGKKIAQLVDGMTLREAAQVPDTIKGWDKPGVDDPKSMKYFSSRPRIAAELREFWRANQPTHDTTSAMPSHHWFHYTDVPVESSKYSAGKTGRSQWDIVHMIQYCIGVLRGEIPEQNPRKITKAVAVILMAHYTGDIHQPLHVGAQYFDRTGHKINPDLGTPGLEDQGGNSISLVAAGGNSDKPRKLHSFWDGDPVLAMFPPGIAAIEDKNSRKTQMEAAEKNLVHAFATQEPPAWRMPASVPLKDYGEAWADEILPIAREAHERLTFQEMTTKVQDDGTTIATGSARDKPMPDHLSYRAWSAKIVRDELHKAGWRLADALEKAVTTGSDQPSVAQPSAPASATAPPTPMVAAAPSAAPLTSDPGRSLYGAYPTNYREIVITWLRSNIPDPANALVAWRSQPKPGDLAGPSGEKMYGYIVLFSIGTRDGAVPAATAQTRAALIHDGQVAITSGF